MPTVDIPGLGTVDFPDSLEPDAFQAAVRRAAAQSPGSVSMMARQRQAAQARQQDFISGKTSSGPAGYSIENPTAVSAIEHAAPYAGSVQRSIDDLKEKADFNSPIKTTFYAANAALSPLYAGMGTVVGAPVGMAAEGAGLGPTGQFLASEIATQGAMAALPHAASPAPTAVERAIEGGIGKKAAGGMQVVETEHGPIRIQGDEPALVETPEGTTIEQNAPAPPEQQAGINARVANPSDAQGTAAQMADEHGIPTPTVTVGDTPISRSFVDDSGQPHMDLAQGTPDEVLHETKHLEAEVKGTPHPPEDNAAIADEYLKSGTETEIKGRPYRVEGYDPKTETYTLTDIKIGRKQPGWSRESVEGGVGPQEPPPEAAQFESAAAPDETIPVDEGTEQTIPVEPDLYPETRPLANETIRSKPAKAAGVVGPKEAMLADSGEAPEWDVPPTGKPRGRAWKPDPTDNGHPPEVIQAVTKQEAAKPKRLLDRVFGGPVNFRTAAMTSAPGTAARNARSQFVTTTMDAIDTAVGNVVARLAGKEPQPNSSLSALGRMFTSAKNDHEAWRALEKISDPALKLEDSYMADIHRQFGNEFVQKVADGLSWANKTVEGWFRRGKAMAALEGIAQSRHGTGATELIMSGKGNVFTEDDIAAAIDGARRNTFALEPKKGTAAEWVLQGRKYAAVRAVQPFLRMGYNLGRFVYEHSPVAAAKFIKPEFWEALSKNSPEAMRQVGAMISGTATLTAVVAGTGTGVMKMKDYDSLAVAGEKLNIAPENPMSLWLLAGFLGNRVLRHDPAPLYEKDLRFIADVVANLGSLGDTNSPAIDALANDLLGTVKGQKGASGQMVMDVAGRWLAAFATPFGALNDLLSGVDPELGIKREAHGLLGPTMAKIPYLNKTLPPRYGTDYAGPQFEEHPVLKQALGMRFEHKGSAANDELEKYQIRPPGKPFGPGYPELNNEYRKLMMEKFDELALPKIKEDKYQNSGNEHRRYLIKHYLAGAAAFAKAQVEKSLPEADRKDFLMSNEYKRLLQEDADESNKNGAEGFIDKSRPILKNDDGSFSTERTITVEEDGKHYLIPSIVGGRQRTNQEATVLWKSGKNPAVGVYDSDDEAEKAAVARSKRIGELRSSEVE